MTDLETDRSLTRADPLRSSSKVDIKKIMNLNSNKIDSIMPGTGVENHPEIRQLRPEVIREAFNPLPSRRV